MDLLKASNKLSALDLRIPLEDYLADILWFRVMQQEGDWHINRHTHSSFEFHFVAGGKCRVILDDRVFLAEEGSFYITAPGVFHEQISEKDSVYTEYSLNCDFQKLNPSEFNSDGTDIVKTEMDLIIEALKSAPCHSYPDKYSITKMFEEALKEAYEEKVGFYNEIKSLAVFMIIKAARTVYSGNQSLKSVVPKKLKQDDARYRMIEQFIEDNVQNTVHTADIAQYMHLSEKQIGRIVKSKSDCSTKELIMHVKLRKAKELLKKSNMTQKEIANALGFTSEYYFNQFFKREEGDAPGSFRSNTQYV
ncbi:MAG: transcriptional regulator, AraC family [Eubacterium sp.]|nr:transcriptional regulator, AraC family [Eubacterium sp.]